MATFCAPTTTWNRAAAGPKSTSPQVTQNGPVRLAHGAVRKPDGASGRMIAVIEWALDPAE